MSHCSLELQDTLHTPWGTAKITGKGYYQISDNQTLHTKKLHRLIYEKFWGVELPSEIHIHHIDENTKNNCILNLEALTKSEHQKKHNLGIKKSLDHKINASKSRNTSGYFRVSEIKDSKCRRNAYWRYRIYIGDGKSESVCADTILELKEKVLAKGWEWRELNGFS